MKAYVVGVRESTNKKGNKAYNLSVKVPYTPYEVETADATLGFNTQNYYTQVNCSGLKPDDEVNLEFEPGFQGQATLSGVHVITPAKK